LEENHLSKTLIIILVAINASLYTVIGSLTYFGIVLFGVRFWPAVIIPGVFSVLFGPVVGGFGAAIGIFLSDMISHGMPFLSLSVGVTSNFIAFYILGYATREYSLKRYMVAAIVSLLVGSTIIGVGVWAWSQFFLLPGAMDVSPMPLFFAWSTFVWTFISEIPFLLIIVPPIVEAAWKIGLPMTKKMSKRKL
jgi:uncharacterized membrane protein